MRLEAINELLGDVSSKINEISTFYDNSRKDETIEKINNPIVKNALENLRSVLDYSACDIYEYVYNVHIDEIGKKIYFPYSNTKNKYKDLIQKSFPGLKMKNQSLYNSILSIQSFITQTPFIYDLCKITNYYKHNNSKKQQRINSGKSTTDLKFKNMDGSFIRIEGDSNVYIKGCSFSNGSKTETVDNLLFSNDRLVKEMNKDLKGKLLIERNFEKVRFDIDGIDILSLIDTAYKEICIYIKNVYKIIS